MNDTNFGRKEHFSLSFHDKIRVMDWFILEICKNVVKCMYNSASRRHQYRLFHHGY